MSGNFAFNSVPNIRKPRSRFDLSHGIKTSGNVGTLYPFDVQEVYAGDTFKIRTNFVCRLSSQFIRPVMDNLFLDVYYFYVPSRLLYDKLVNIFGENTDSAWANLVEFEVPMTPSLMEVPEKTVGDYLGLPTKTPLPPVSVLPFRAFAKIYNEWFRDENNIAPMHIQTGETVSSEVATSSPWSPAQYFGKCPPVARFHDYFSSCLPAPQKGNAVSVPIAGTAPVYTRVEKTPLSPFTDNGSLTGTLPGGTAGDLTISPLSGDSSRGEVQVRALGTATTVRGGFTPDNLWASLDFADGGFTVNDLRFAFQYQKMLERDARSGTRYVEYLLSHFGVQAGDYRLQRSEFLGGRRFPINIQQVVQSTGSGSSTSPLGELGAYSLSNGSSKITKSFVENGYVIGVFCIRQFHTYQQGVERFWRRSKRTDFYDPVFANIGEQPVMKTEIFSDAGTISNDIVFGYQEAWADLRSRFNKVTGQMRSNATDSLDIWHFADNYSNAPSLTPSFINETPTYVDRAIGVSSVNQDQFILDFFVNNVAYRALPTYSVPSLIDHN